MEYLLKVSAVIAIFYLCYKLFLQRDTFFEFNRTFLLLGILMAFLLPFIVIPIYIEYTPINLSNFTTDNFIETEHIEESFNFVNLFFIIYVFGVIGFSIRFIVQLVSLSRVIINNKREKLSHFTIITTTNNILPFSFFKWIVFNPSLFNKEELKQIIAHEHIHVKQYHSIDNILTQLACIVLWFNPFIWLYNKDLKQNLEFIADQNAQQKTECKKNYQYTLLKTSMPTHQSALTNNFYNSLIKKRIIMLHKSKSKKINLIKYALIIPILGLFLMSFNTEEVYVKKEILDTNNANLNPLKTKDIKIIFDKHLKDNELEKIRRKLKKDDINFSYSNLKRNEQKDIISISTKFEYRKGNATWNAYNTNNQPIKAFYFFKTKKEFGVSILKKDTEQIYKSKKENTILKISGTVTNNEGRGLPGANIFIEGKPNGVVTDFDGNYKIEAEKGDILIISYKGMLTQKVRVDNNNNNNQINIQLQPENKKNELSPWKVSAGSKTYKLDLDDPIVLLDGKEISKKEFENINHDNIKSIDVFKDEIATKKYGDKGKNGVIIITTKGKASEVTVIGYGKPSDSNKNIKIGHKIKVDSDEQPLVIVNSKELPYEKLENIKPDNIESMNVLKDGKAIEKYGDKGKNGVIIITTKGKESDITVIGYGKPSDSNKNIKIGHKIKIDRDKQPLVIVDGKEISNKKLEDIDKNNIESMNVLKDKKAIEKYGKKGKNGVVEITTKK